MSGHVFREFEILHLNFENQPLKKSRFAFENFQNLSFLNLGHFESQLGDCTKRINNSPKTKNSPKSSNQKSMVIHKCKRAQMDLR